MSEHVLGFAQRLYRVTLDFITIAEIEDELGSVAALQARLHSAQWTAGEVVTVCHILLGRAGCSCDYMALGQEMVQQGFARYRATVMQLIDDVFV